MEDRGKCEEAVLRVSLAGLFHDVGKFDQGSLVVSEEYRQSNADLYQPFHRGKGYHTHLHALYTAAFIEQYSSYFPPVLLSRQEDFGEVTDSFINLAAKHHKPETPLQWIIAL